MITSGIRAATDDEVRERIADAQHFDLLLCGHTHIPRARQLPSAPLIVNPGSVGWPAIADDTPYPHALQAGTPHARYALVDNSSGRWEAELRAIDCPVEEAAQLATTHGRPDIAFSLRTGRTS